MGKVALDSSVIISWLIGDSTRLGEGKDVIDKILFEGREIVAPKLLLLELINILCWRKKIDRREVKKMVSKVDDLEIDWVDSNDIDPVEIISMVFMVRLTPYDAWFLQVARQQGCQLITYDQDLLKADKKRCVNPRQFLEEG